MRSFQKLVFVALGLSIVSGCQFDLQVPAPQRGRVVGSLDTQGHLPVEGQTITLASDKGERRTQLTDAEGAFVFADLPPGLNIVSVALPGFAKLSSDLLPVTSGQDTDVGVLRPDWLQNSPSAGSINGKVAAAADGDVSGAKVEFVLAGTVIDQVTVGADGLFVKPLPPGTFVLRASHPAFVTFQLMDVTLLPGATLDLTSTPLVLAINPATLSGSVFKERDQLQPDAAAGAIITLDSGQTTTVDVPATSSSRGWPPAAARCASPCPASTTPRFPGRCGSTRAPPP